MEIVCDLDASAVSLVDPEDLGRFSVRVIAPEGAGPGDAARLGELLWRADAARMNDGGDALVSPDWVRTSAQGRVGADWENGFAGMCAYATSKGWIAEDGSIQAHVEWPA